MKKIMINNNTPEKLKVNIIKFIYKYGDGRITLRAINWIKKTAFSSLNYDNGDLIHIYLDNNKKICGVIAISNFGLKHSIIVVHPDLRKKGIAKNILNEALNELDRFYALVACDNIPSLKLCFSYGMKAFKLIKGPTGKPTLVLGCGNYSIEEWSIYNQK